jgi:hypothetical protein
MVDEIRAAKSFLSPRGVHVDVGYILNPFTIISANVVNGPRMITPVVNIRLYTEKDTTLNINRLFTALLLIILLT